MILFTLIILLLIMIIYDFRYRYVYIWQLILFAVAQITFCLSTMEQIAVYKNLLTNGLTILLISLLVKLYVFLRFRKEGREAIGWGDIIFIFTLTPYFSASTFIYFMIISLLLTLGGWFIYCTMGSKPKNIPLISTLGICYGLFLIYNSMVI